jgi:hypothetical protein
VADVERKHETKIPYIVETKDGPIKGIIDLEAMSYEELVARVTTIPAAMDEIVYRDMLGYTNNTNK